MATDAHAAPSASFRAKGPSYLATIAVGHGIKHFYVAAFAVFLPLIEDQYALTAVGVAAIGTIRQFGAGAPNFIVGYISDRLRNYWHMLLPISLLAAASFLLLAGLSPWYWPLVVAIALAGASASFWHPPAISMLSLRFPQRRGMAIAFHGAGSGAGEALGPLIVGFILVAFLANDWRAYVTISFLPAVLLAVLLFWMLKGAFVPPKVEAHHAPPRMADIFRMLRFPVYRSLAFANFSRSFSHFGLLAFLPIYLARDLNMDAAGQGFHIALLTLLGVGAGPAFGYLSDRTGRRNLMVVAFSAIAVGMLAVGISGSGILLTIALAITGIFLWSVQDVINATAMDAAPRGSEGTVVGLMFTSSFMAGVIAPIIMGALITIFDNRIVIFYASGIIMVPAAIAMLFAPLTRKMETN
jgi:MFS transporter, FSR family, fosmidomycin resistance protein